MDIKFGIWTVLFWFLEPEVTIFGQEGGAKEEQQVKLTWLMLMLMHISSAEQEM